MTSPYIIRTIAYLAMFGAMLFFEWLAPHARSEQKKSYRVALHLGLSIGNSVIVYFVMTRPIFTSLSLAQNYLFGVRHFFGLHGGWEILATVIAFDFWDYWMHRANHRVGFLWRFHQAHHSDMEIDVTTAARFHFGELILSSIFKCLMILAWGPSLRGLVAFDLCLNFGSQFHHSNLGIPLKIQDVLEKVVVTPRMHRCHHSLHRDCFNTNFATLLNIWDRIFRSYHWAKSAPELVPIGLYKIRGPETMQLKSLLLTPLKKV